MVVTTLQLLLCLPRLESDLHTLDEIGFCGEVNFPRAKYVNDTQALAAVRDDSLQTTASEPVQKHIRQRVAGFPAAVRQALHRAHAVVPRSVAAVLRAQPQLVAPAVEAFFYRDDDDLKVSASLQHR